MTTDDTDLRTAVARAIYQSAHPATTDEEAWLTEWRWGYADVTDRSLALTLADAAIAAAEHIIRRMVIAELVERAIEESDSDLEGCTYFVHNGVTYYDPADWLRSQEGDHE